MQDLWIEFYKRLSINVKSMLKLKRVLVVNLTICIFEMKTETVDIYVSTVSYMLCMRLVFYFFTISVKYSLQSFTTIGLSNASAIKLGIAMRPFKVSAIAQARSSSTLPAIQAKIQKIT